MLRMPLVREDRRFFVGEIREETSHMNRYLTSHSGMILLPSGEIKETEIKTDDQILMNNKAA
jgi:hypothetical protein